VEKSSSPTRSRSVFISVLAVIAAGGFVFFSGRNKTVEKPAVPDTFAEQSVTPEAEVPLSDSLAEQSTPEATVVPEKTLPSVEVISEKDIHTTVDPFADWIPFVSVKPLVVEPLQMRPKELPEPITEPESVPEAVIPSVVVIISETEPETEPLAVLPPVVALKPEPETLDPPEEEPTPEPESEAIKPPAVVVLTPEPEPQPAAIPIPPPISKTATLSIDSPSNGDVYHSFVSVSGRGEPGVSLSWMAPALDVEGKAVVDDEGNFSFSVPSLKFRGNLIISVRSGGDGAIGEEVSIQLFNDNEGPSLLVMEPSEGSFYQDFLPVAGAVGPGSRDSEGVGRLNLSPGNWRAAVNHPGPCFLILTAVMSSVLI